MINYKDLKQLDTAGTYLVRLLRSILHEKDIPALPSNLNWNLIFYMAKIHSVETMVFYGVEEFIKGDEELYNMWKRHRDANIAQNLIQIEAREEIFHSLDNTNIRFLPLKGFELKRLYKRSEFRQMSDIDILIDIENASLIKTIMYDLGYTLLKEFSSYEEYIKPPCIAIEFHKQLFSKDTFKYDYYKNIWKKTIPDEEISGGLKLTPEDFYIFQIAHLWKHYNEFGSGIRPIMDIYVYLNKFREKMNWLYVKQELQKIELYDFSIKIEALSLYWFSDPSEEKKIYMKDLLALQRNTFLSGIYGSKEAKRLKEMNDIKIEKGNLQKLTYIFNRLFISRKELETFYPILKKIPVLMPFLWIHRIGYAILYKKSIIKKEIELFQAKSKDK